MYLLLLVGVILGVKNVFSCKNSSKKLRCTVERKLEKKNRKFHVLPRLQCNWKEQTWWIIIFSLLCQFCWHPYRIIIKALNVCNNIQKSICSDFLFHHNAARSAEMSFMGDASRNHCSYNCAGNAS